MKKSDLRAIILEELEKSNASLLMEKFASSIIGDINQRISGRTAKDLWNSTANTYGIAWDKVKDEHVSTGANPRRNQLNIFFVEEGTENPYVDSRYGVHRFYRDALLGISVGKKVIGFSGQNYYKDPAATKKARKVDTNADNYSKVGVGVDAKVWNYKRMLEVSTEVFSIDIDAIQNWNRELQTLRAEQKDGAIAMQQHDEILKGNKNRYKKAIKAIKDAGVAGKEFEIVMEHLADAEKILTKELKQKIKDTRRGVVYPGWDNPFQLAVNLHSDMVKKFEDFQRYAADAKKEGGKWYARYLTEIAHDVQKIKADFDRRIAKVLVAKQVSIHESVLPVYERNAFLGARAKAIEEDLEEFEFNGKIYPVTKSKKVNEKSIKCTNKKGHSWKEIDKDGTVECEHCGLRNSLSESIITEKKGGFVAIYKVMGQEFKFGPLKTDDKKSIVAMLSSAIQGGFQLVRVVPADQVKESLVLEAASLVDEVTGKAVKLPYKTKDFRGDPIKVTGFTEPHKSSSSGRIQTDKGEFFPGVAGVKIVGHEFESLDYNESVNEEYIELIDGKGDVGAGLELIEEAWLAWNRGPMTEPKHIKPAAKELKAWITKWLKDTIK